MLIGRRGEERVNYQKDCEAGLTGGLPQLAQLEAEAGSKFSGERVRYHHTAGAEKSGRRLERAGPDIGAVIRAEVRPIREIECLEEQAQFHFLADLNQLA